MSSGKLTDTAVKNAKPPTSGERSHLWDASVPGFGLRISPQGTKSWVFSYRTKAGQQRRMTIGRYPAMKLADARKAASTAHTLVRAGEDPAAAAPAPAQRKLSDVLEAYLVREVRPNLRPRSAHELERALKYDLEAKLGDRLIKSITRQDMVDVIDAIGDRKRKILANRVLALCKTFFSWCVQRGEIDISPCAALKKPSREIARERALDGRELVAVWKASDRLGFPFAAIVKLLILTGQRRDEVGAMRWTELDLPEMVWTIPAERSKNGRLHSVFLAPEALKVLKDCPRQGEADFVFTTTGETSVSGWSAMKKRLDRFLVEPEGDLIGPPPAIAHWRLHDLRRSCATGMADLGIAPHVIEAVLNHSTGAIKGVARVYNRSEYRSERAAALALWAGHLVALVEGRTGDAVEQQV